MVVEPIATIPCSCSRILKAGGVVQTRSVFLKIYADREFWVLPGVLTNGNNSGTGSTALTDEAAAAFRVGSSSKGQR